MGYELKCRFCHEILEKCVCSTVKIRKFSAKENAEAAKRGRNKSTTRRESNLPSNTTTDDKDIRRS